MAVDMLTPHQRRTGRRNKWLLLAYVVGLVAVFSVAMILAYQAAPNDDVRVLTDQGERVVDGPVADYVYNTLPPASGPHVEELAAWGEHAETVPNWVQVANLAAGGVIIHYDCPEGCPGWLADLRAILDTVGEDGVILHPYPDLDHAITLTAWARMLPLDILDRSAILDFIAAYRDPVFTP